jgi:hypothetical protein
VLFQLPETQEHSGIELGMVLSVWKGVMNPRLFAGETHVNSCVAFRAVALEMVDQENNAEWWCSSTSVAWVVRLESLVCILDCDSCALLQVENVFHVSHFKTQHIS